VVLSHARALLADNSSTFVAQASLLDPASILENPAVRSHLDWDQPIGLLLCGIVHYITDEEGPTELVAALVDALPSGSYVFIHHLLDTGGPSAAELQAHLLKGLGRAQFRTLAQVRQLFGDLELVEPGLVTVPQWRPAPGTPARADYGAILSMACAGVGKKPLASARRLNARMPARPSARPSRHQPATARGYAQPHDRRLGARHGRGAGIALRPPHPGPGTAPAPARRAGARLRAVPARLAAASRAVGVPLGPLA
jgi:hypothetical protein